ncbi:MAG TPA: hypothetical protein VM841_06075 [Actinomycetota bacterium]|nr:hypothetical protein [Actinomycetota bacterium]
MRWGIGVFGRALLVILAVLALSLPAFAGESCVSEPDSNPGSVPGVTLGPATKCVRDDGGTTTADQAPAGARGEGQPISWVTIAGAGLAVGGFSYGSWRVRRRFHGVDQTRANTAA